MRRSIHFCCLLWVAWIGPRPDGHGKSQERDSTKTGNHDSTVYIVDFQDKFYIKPLVTVRSLNLDFRDENENIDDITYSATTNAYLGLGIYLFDIGLEVSFRLPNESQDPTTYGETDVLDFQTNIYGRKWGGDLAFQRYSGFFLEQPGDHLASWQQGDPYPQRPDLSMSNSQLNVFYIFNHNRFSYRSAFNQADMQTRSAGSFLLGLSTSTFSFSADSTLIPQESRDSFAEDAIVSGARFTVLGLLPGYAHNFIYKQFYLNVSLSVGPAHLWTRYTTEDRERNEIGIQPILNLRSAIGYNSDSFFGGISVVNHAVSNQIDNLDIRGSSGNVKFFVGYRFQEKGFLAKSIL